jgi:hypothetical protein
MANITINDESLRQLEFLICEHLGDTSRNISTRRFNELKRLWIEKFISDEFDKWQEEQDKIAEERHK